MPEKTEKNLTRLKAEIRSLNKSKNDLKSAKDDIDAHIAWANFVRSLKLAINLLIRIGKSKPEKRPSAWRRHNFSTVDDVLQFMIDSRNDIDHPEDEKKENLISGKINEDSFEIEPLGRGSSLAKVGKNASFIMSGCVVNGRPVSGYLINKSGETSIGGNLKVIERPKDYYLQHVTLKDGRRVPVPLCPSRGVVFSASEMANYANEWLLEGLHEILDENQVKFVES